MANTRLAYAGILSGAYVFPKYFQQGSLLLCIFVFISPDPFQSYKMALNIGTELTNKGFAVVESFFPPPLLEALENALLKTGAFRFENDYDKGTANLLVSCKAVKEIAGHPKLKALFRTLSPGAFVAIKAFVLDKTTGANWEIPWHQDLKIAVNKQDTTEGYSNWSLEAGIWHVQPPISILESLLTLRIHLDDCSANNGAMHFIPATHNLGILDKEDISNLVAGRKAVVNAVPKGGITLFRPLLLHYAPPSQSQSGRRVLQIEYSAADPGHKVDWHRAE
jgi:ectoine hydroxylase-related dioxygenase (phytanoyl-CoA dioxygenase family)